MTRDRAQLEFAYRLPDITRNYHGGNAQSEAANRRTDKQKNQQRIYAHVHGLGLWGATCDEIEVALDLIHQTASSRCTEMKKDGDLIDTGERRKTRTGSDAAVYVTKTNWRVLR